jgi:hypothetical protein
MKRQVIAVALGSLFALPAFANNEINAGYAAPVAVSAKSRADVHAELIAAKHSGNWMVNAELGTRSVLSAAQLTSKTRAQVLAEVEQARRSGNYIVNAELGTKANQL